MQAEKMRGGGVKRGRWRVRVMLCATAAVRISAVLLLLSLGFLFQKWRCGKMMGKSGKPQCWFVRTFEEKRGKKEKEERNALVVGRVCSCSPWRLDFLPRSLISKPSHQAHAQVQHAPPSSPPSCWWRRGERAQKREGEHGQNHPDGWARQASKAQGITTRRTAWAQHGSKAATLHSRHSRHAWQSAQAPPHAAGALSQR